MIDDDADLVPLLRQASIQELAPLVEYILVKGKLSSELGKTRKFKEHYPNHCAYADDIAAEIQKFGANTVVGQILRRGRGVSYKEIVTDVAKRLKVDTESDASVEDLEQRIFTVVIKNAWEHISDTERHEILMSFQVHKVDRLGGSVSAAAVQTTIQATGFGPYMLSVIVANGLSNAVLGHGLSFALNAALTKGIAVFAGPIGWALNAIWAGVAIAGPAYRVTIPCVIQTGFIRQTLRKREREARAQKWRLIFKTSTIAMIIALLLLVIYFLIFR